MELSHSSEIKTCSAAQVIPRILCTPNAHYPVYKSPHMAPNLGQLNKIDTLKSYFFKIHFNIILLYIRLSSDLFSLGFLTENMYSLLPQSPCMSEPLFCNALNF
jgi:hypothetical protein